MNWFTWLALGVVIGWLAKAAIVEWRMRMLQKYVVDVLMEMREQWKAPSA